MSKRPALGRGLASLIPDAEPVNERPITSDGGLSGDRVHSIQVDLIDPGRYQPRTEFHEEALEELTQSIREKGILQPLIARHNGERFELIAGERRLRAARAAGLQHVPLIVRDVSDQESLELALIENIQRNDLNAIELARAFLQLQEDFGYTHEEVSRRVGKDRSTITNHLRLLKLPESVAQSLLSGSITMGHARALLGLEDRALQEKGLEKIREGELSVRETEVLVKRLKQPHVPKPAPVLSTEVSFVTDRLRRTFQTQVEIFSRRSGGGEIRIAYYSPEELNRILELIPEP